MAEEKAANILIAVPTTGGSMKARTAESLIKLVKVLTRRGIDADILNINNSDVVAARNRYANLVLTSEKWDALLFIDSDMQFLPRTIARMIEINVGVAAAVCTTRELDLEKFGNAMREHGDFERAKAESSRFNVLPAWNKNRPPQIRQRGGFMTAAAVGMAVCLIRKSALQAMIDAKAVEQRLDRFGEGIELESWGFFDLIKSGNIAFSEDFSFCHRWTYMMRRPLWVCIDEDVKHIGDFSYSARYATVLDSKLAKPAPAHELAQQDAGPAD